MGTQTEHTYQENQQRGAEVVVGPHTLSAADLSSGGMWRKLHKLWGIYSILALGCEGTNHLSFLGCFVIKNMGT